MLAFLSANGRFAYRLHLDIRRYFPTVRHTILERLLFREIRDRRIRWLIQRILTSGASIHKSASAKRALTLNPRHYHVETTQSSPSVFLGYRVSHSGIGPSRKLRRRMQSRITVAAKKGPNALQRTLTSYRGLVLF